MITPTKLIAGAVAFLPFTSAFFRMPCSGPLVTERADPIVNPGAVSGHLHSILGGNAFDFNMTYDGAREGTCSTCMVKQDMSNYWVPTLFYQAQNGTFTPVSQNGGTIYYLQRGANDSEVIHPFPPGFRMLAGNPTLRNFTNTLAAKAVTYNCLGVTGPQTNNIPNQDCPDGLRSQIFFPSCWDGVNVDSADHQSHMAYPDGVDSGKCPSSHPVRLISIFYEIIWGVTAFKNDWYGSSHPFVFSMGDPTGYGYHGDFVNGWDQATLASAVKDCTNLSGDIHDCPVLQLFTGTEQSNCFVEPKVNELTTGWLNALPGCNKVQAGPSPAVAAATCNAPKTIGTVAPDYTDETAKGWSYVGCVLDSLSSRVLPTRYAKDNMTVDYCMDYCTQKGATYAGVEWGQECYCGTTVADSVLANVHNKCEQPCAGNSSQVCGDGAKLNLYKKGSSKSRRSHLAKHARRAAVVQLTELRGA